MSETDQETQLKALRRRQKLYSDPSYGGGMGPDFLHSLLFSAQTRSQQKQIPAIFRGGAVQHAEAGCNVLIPLWRSLVFVYITSTPA